MPIGRRLRRLICDRLLLPYALLRHSSLLRSGRRVNNHTYTCFLRAPAQLDLLCGPILTHLGRPSRLNITLLACSNGAEPYTISSWLLRNAPGMDFHIRASDLHPEMVERARRATYTRDEVLHSDYITEDFIKATFDERDGAFVIRSAVRDRVSFSTASLLDREDLLKQFGQAPLVIAQNVLFHLEPAMAQLALRNLADLTTAGGVLLVEGMDLDLREKATERLGLEPFTENQQRIHEETRIHTPARWWRYYWGTEPYMALRRNALRRYATAFKRGREVSLEQS